MSPSNPRPVSLSAEQRANLDPRVDPDRLAEFLARIPAEAQRYALNACSVAGEPGGFSLIGSTNPELDALWHQVWRQSEPAV